MNSGPNAGLYYEHARTAFKLKHKISYTKSSISCLCIVVHLELLEHFLSIHMFDLYCTLQLQIQKTKKSRSLKQEIETINEILSGTEDITDYSRID